MTATRSDARRPVATPGTALAGSNIGGLGHVTLVTESMKRLSAGRRGAAERLRSAPAGVVDAAAIAVVVLLGVADYVTGPDLSPSLFYLVPVSLAAWFGRRSSAYVAAVASAVACAAVAWFWDAGPNRPFVVGWNAVATLAILATVAGALAALRAALERESALAAEDYLTGLLNARTFYALGEMELRKGQRHGQPLTVAFIDVDDLLRTVAVTLLETLRSTDLIARMGGDEFAVLLPQTDADAAHVVIPTLQEALLRASRRKNLAVTFSVGCVCSYDFAGALDGLLARADSLMYGVKARGKNGVAIETHGG